MPAPGICELGITTEVFLETCGDWGGEDDEEKDLIFEGDLVLSIQLEIKEFMDLGFKEITGSLKINPVPGSPSKIIFM